MLAFVLFAGLLAPQAASQAPSPALIREQLQQRSSPFTGDGVSSSSRGCNGYLRIHPHWLDWELTNFSCHHVAYQTIKQSPNEYIYRLEPKSRKCDFKILVVQHTEDGQGFWFSVGYQTEAGWHRQDSSQSLACPEMF